MYFETSVLQATGKRVLWIPVKRKLAVILADPVSDMSSTYQLHRAAFLWLARPME